MGWRLSLPTDFKVNCGWSNLDFKIEVGRLSAASLAKGISHGGITAQERVEKLCWGGGLPFGSRDSICVWLWRKEHVPKAEDFLKFLGVWRMKRAVEGIHFILNVSGMESSANGGDSPSRSRVPPHSRGSARGGSGGPVTSQPGHPVLQAPPSLQAGECWGCLIPPPRAPALFVKQKGFLEQHQAALADRCLRISSLPAARRQVSAPPANKLGPDPGDCFPSETHRGKYTLCKGIFTPQSRAWPHIYPRARKHKNLWLHFPFFFNSLCFTGELLICRTLYEECQK